jgi:hypothetical protein
VYTSHPRVGKMSICANGGDQQREAARSILRPMAESFPLVIELLLILRVRS